MEDLSGLPRTNTGLTGTFTNKRPVKVDEYSEVIHELKVKNLVNDNGELIVD